MGTLVQAGMGSSLRPVSLLVPPLPLNKLE